MFLLLLISWSRSVSYLTVLALSPSCLVKSIDYSKNIQCVAFTREHTHSLWLSTSRSAAHSIVWDQGCLAKYSFWLCLLFLTTLLMTCTCPTFKGRKILLFNVLINFSPDDNISHLDTSISAVSLNNSTVKGEVGDRAKW